MKISAKRMTCWAFALATALSLSVSAETVIQSMDDTGTLAWTNNAHPNARYHVEWAATATGPWYRSWQALSDIQSQTQTSYEVTVPRFYRVTMVTNHPPEGMVLIDNGPFIMGDDGLSTGWLSAEPRHEVNVPPFYMDKYEVSNAQMAEVLTWATHQGLVIWYGVSDFARNLADSQPIMYMGTNTGNRITYDPFNTNYVVDAGAENLPVVDVTWRGAIAYCNFKSDMEGLERASTSAGFIYYDREGYRLPTEAEWEKAARGGLADNFYPWPSYGGSHTDHIDRTMANFSNSGDPYEGDPLHGVTPVGYYNGTQVITNDAGELLLGPDMANGYGLYDMAGNVSELCLDRPYTNYVGSPVDGTAANGPEVNHRIVRGGSYKSGFIEVLCAYRDDVLYDTHPYRNSEEQGFRAVRRAP